MKLIDRYLFRQLLVTALFAITVLTVVLVLGNVFKKLFDQFSSPPPSLIFTIIAYVVPFSLTFTIPWGFLTAVLLVFGRMSAENEITALRSSGISIPRLCVPVAIIAVIFACICAYINLEVAPRSQANMKNSLYELATNNPLAIFGDDKVIDVFPGQKIYVEKNEGKNIENMLVYVHDDAGNLKTVTVAGKGTLELKPVVAKGGESQKQLVLTYEDLRYEQIVENTTDPENKWDRRGIKSGIVAGEGQVFVSLKELYERKKKTGGIGMLAVAELLDNTKPEASVELNKRLSLALATIAFALLAVPLGITAQRKETSVGFAISLGIAMLYFLLLVAADMMRDRANFHPSFLVWLPNIIFIGIGAYRFAQLAKR